MNKNQLYKRIVKSISHYGGVQRFKEHLMPHGVRSFNYYESGQGPGVSADFMNLILEEEKKWYSLANTLIPDFISPRQAANRLIKKLELYPELKHYLAYFLEYGNELYNLQLLRDHFGYGGEK